MMTRISVIIPAYNEGKRIETTLNSVLKTFNDVEILIISNGSKDNTIEIAKKWKEKNDNINYLDFPNKLGKGGAIIEGLKIAKGDVIGFIDADDAFDLEFLRASIEKYNIFDCIIASKWKERNFFRVNEPFLRKILSRGWNILTRLLLKLHYNDTQAGAKFFKKSVIGKIGYDFISKGFAFDIELLNRIKKNNFIIKEVYIPSKFVEGSTFRIKHCPNMLKDLLKVWWSR